MNTNLKHTDILNIFDLDNTLVTSKTKVVITDLEGTRLRSLSSAEFRDYVPNDNEKIDYAGFRCARSLAETIQPISGPVFRFRYYKQCGDTNIICTARERLNDMPVFIEALNDCGIFIRESHLEFAGEVMIRDNIDIPEAKCKIIAKYLQTNKYGTVHFFEDHIANLDAFFEMRSRFPDVSFIATYVAPDGTMSEYDKE